MELKLGILGLSPGNGHPFSWSAIFNGYNSVEMETCGFPVIPKYLSEQKWPESKLSGAVVTHIWTQNRELSNKIAAASYIENVVDRPEEIVGKVDAVLLARDDAENHLFYARPFLSAGIPIYIDKPIALDVAALSELYSHEEFPGQIFTCSALRYSKELALDDEARHSLGVMREINAVTPKSWDKYSVHIIEPVLAMLEPNDEISSFSRFKSNDGSITLVVQWSSGIVTRFSALGDVASPISIRLSGEYGWLNFTFADSFSAFKLALSEFIDGVRFRVVKSPRKFNERVVELIEAGRGGE